MISIRAAAPLLLLVLTGCVTGPDHVAPDMALPQKFSEGSKKSDGDVTMTAWWTAFNDRKLNTLIDQGVSQNLDVLQALERINSAEANIVVSQAGALPRLDVSAAETVSGSRGSFNGGTPTRRETAGGAGISWLHRNAEVLVKELHDDHFDMTVRVDETKRDIVVSKYKAVLHPDDATA